MNPRLSSRVAGFLLHFVVTLAAFADVQHLPSPTLPRPNLLIIHTDEHNFRTLGCYRALLPTNQAYVWGDGVAVETPNIDWLAQHGSLAGVNFFL